MTSSDLPSVVMKRKKEREKAVKGFSTYPTDNNLVLNEGIERNKLLLLFFSFFFC